MGFFYQRLDKRLSKNGEAGELSRHRTHYDSIVIDNVILVFSPPGGR